MFTGIIEDIGDIKSIKHEGDSAVLVIRSSKIMDDVKLGDSIAVNGVCLTARSISGNEFTADGRRPPGKGSMSPGPTRRTGPRRCGRTR